MDTKRKARNIAPGDVLLDEGELVYTVEHLARENGKVYAFVRYASDGGDGARVWDENDDTFVQKPPLEE